MKYSLVFSAGLGSTALAATTSSANVCSTGILPLFAPLSTFPAAVSYCSSKYPGTTSTVTVTAAAQVTTTTATTTQSNVPNAPYKKKRDAWSFLRRRDVKAVAAQGLEARAPAPATASTSTSTIKATTTSSTKTTTTSSTKTTSTTSATGKTALWSSLASQASTLVSQFCSCYDPPQTVLNTVTVTPTSTSTTVTTTTTNVLQSAIPCATASSLDPNDPSDITQGSGCSGTPVNCVCERVAGQDTGGVCAAAYYPQRSCRVNTDCPNGEYCLGFPDPNSQSYDYYCSNTQSCVTGNGLYKRGGFPV